MSKSEIFNKAWKLAKEGAARFGGSCRDYFAQALKMAYAATKIYRDFIGNVRSAWTAKIVGTDKKFGLAREFVFNAKSGKVCVDLTEGIYEEEINGDRYFFEVKNGKALDITREAVMARMA